MLASPSLAWERRRLAGETPALPVPNLIFGVGLVQNQLRIYCPLMRK